jgi:hypothetical protein
MTTPTIVIDTREQLPLEFNQPTLRGPLPTGDYSIKGLERFVAIERKSAGDLVGCLKGQNRERFERELSRGRGLDYFALVVEADLAGLAVGAFVHTVGITSNRLNGWQFNFQVNPAAYPSLCPPTGYEITPIVPHMCPRT